MEPHQEEPTKRVKVCEGPSIEELTRKRVKGLEPHHNEEQRRALFGNIGPRALPDTVTVQLSGLCLKLSSSKGGRKVEASPRVEPAVQQSQNHTSDHSSIHKTHPPNRSGSFRKKERPGEISLDLGEEFGESRSPHGKDGNRSLSQVRQSLNVRTPARRRGSTLFNLSGPQVSSEQRAGSPGRHEEEADAPVAKASPRRGGSPPPPQDDENLEGGGYGGCGTLSQKEAMWQEVFNKVREDGGELHKDTLMRALELCGIHAHQEWVDEALGMVTKFSSLGEQEFQKFVRVYLKRQAQAHAAYFAECDEDGSGHIDMAELSSLLQRCDIMPMRHVLADIVAEVDTDGEGTLDLFEFREVLGLLWTREGFTKQEHQHFMEVYHMFDRDKSSEIDTRELMALLNYLGYAFDRARTAEVVTEVDVDGSGLINEREFIMCMRKVREREIQSLTEMMRNTDEDGNGTVSGKEMHTILKGLGYDHPCIEAMREAAAENSLCLEEELDLTDLWKLLTVYRVREGLSLADIGSIETAFQRYDKESCGQISTVDVGKMLRWLGYSAPFEVQQKFISRVDVDESGSLEVSEFMKMIRMFRQWEQELMKDAWAKAAGESHTISMSQCVRAIESLGLLEYKSLNSFKLQPEEISRSCFLRGEIWVDLDGFLRVAMRLSSSAREAFCQNGGFSAKEAQEMQTFFQRYDADGSGDISNKELVFLIEELFPEMANDIAMRPRLLEIMKEVDGDGNGSLDFQDFIRLMKEFRELQDRERIRKELVAVQETGFSSTEVSDFRELFLNQDDGSGELSLQEVIEMISMITPLGDNLRAELTKMFFMATSRQCRVEGAKDSADFPEFLWLMKECLECNFANIKAKTKLFVSEEPRERACTS